MTPKRSPLLENRRRKRSRSRSPGKMSSEEDRLRRQVGSLSPASTFRLDAFPPLDLTLMTPSRSSSPTRVPASGLQLGSIGKAVASGLETPARRIPVQDAVLKGFISPAKGAQLLARPGSSNSPAKPPSGNSLHVQPQDSPTRMLSHPHSSNLSGQPTGLVAASPSKPPSRIRAGSVEPKPSFQIATAKKRQLSAEPAFPPSTNTSSTSRSALPFPLLPSIVRRPEPIAEEPAVSLDPPSSTPASSTGEKSASASKTLIPTLPSLKITAAPKSSLRQATSRIPRPNAKPYARPTSSTGARQQPIIRPVPAQHDGSHRQLRTATEVLNKTVVPFRESCFTASRPFSTQEETR
ncbi:hypothetical protein DL96DRAFT_447825 [Flagelloscypha sp. PMI_526]|nr:hypothetical protein DL96DRAFT_447825 [Flagelloscypha sp. PMI_526]